MRFKDRTDAGRRLADRLRALREAAVVYALPRGGVVLGVIVARQLKAPLDLMIARKIGHPLAPEYAIAAVTEDGALLGNPAELAEVDERWLRQRIHAEREEAHRRRVLYMAGRLPHPVEGKTAVIVDDGVATGLTLRAAIRDVLRRHPRRIVVAVPVIPPDVADVVREEIDELITLDSSAYLGAVGAYYDDFAPVEDDEVAALMRTVEEPKVRTPELV